jgi:site-specific recombinase XerD
MLLQYYKLPEQETYLLDIKNNNYSKRTVYNYDRDLSIFARFIDHRNKMFDEIDKVTLTHYKGYLQAGDHLKVHKRDKDILEERLKEISGSKQSQNDGTITETKASLSRGSRTHGKDLEDLEHLDDPSKMANLKAEQLLGLKSGGSGGGLSSRSVNRMLSALRSYLKWRVDFDKDIPIPPEAIRLIKTERKKSQVAELDELISLIEFPSKFEKDPRVAARNRAMLELLFSTGMRISELVNLNLDQINTKGKIFIMGKGKKERFVYLTPRATHHLNEYLKVRSVSKGTVDTVGKPQNDDKIENVAKKRGSVASVEQNRQNKVDLSPTLLSRKKGDAVFIPYRGGRNGRVGSRISTNYLQEKIVEYRRRLGIVVPTSAHSLRHGFATYMAEGGANPAAIQVLLGHESLQTTTRYVHASDKFAEETHRRNHPLQN